MKMDDLDSGQLNLDPKIAEFLSGPATMIDVIQLVQPLRAATLVLFDCSLVSLVSLINELPDGDTKDKVRECFDKLRDIFEPIDDFDRKINCLLSGKPLSDLFEESPTLER